MKSHIIILLLYIEEIKNLGKYIINGDIICLNE